MRCELGIDIGTTSTIGILVRMPDQVLAVASRRVTLVSREPGWAEEAPPAMVGQLLRHHPDQTGQDSLPKEMS
jgi:sugar (pentulose or hexulose) kinase